MSFFIVFVFYHPHHRGAPLCNDHCFDKLVVTIWSGSVLFGSGSPTRVHHFDLLCFMVWTFGPISQFPGVQTLDKDCIISHLIIISSLHHTLLCCCQRSSIHILGQRVREGLKNFRIGLVGSPFPVPSIHLDFKDYKNSETLWPFTNLVLFIYYAFKLTKKKLRKINQNFY